MSATPPTPPAATPPPAGPPAAAGPKQTQSIIGFVLGLVSVVFGWVALIGVGAGIAGLIVSRKAKKDEPGAPSWMHTIGLIAEHRRHRHRRDLVHLLPDRHADPAHRRSARSGVTTY